MNVIWALRPLASTEAASSLTYGHQAMYTVIFVATLHDNSEQSCSQKNDFDLLTSNDPDLRPRSLKI